MLLPEVVTDRDSSNVDLRYSAPAVAPLSRVRIVDRFPWGGPSFSIMGRHALVVGMEARIALVSDAKYGNDSWDYKLEIEGGGFPPVWLPSSCIQKV